MSDKQLNNMNNFTTKYEKILDLLKQFETNDDRSPQEIAHVIRNANYEAVWKDWDAVYVNG